MASTADRIMKRVRAKNRGGVDWVFTSHDFLDLGPRASVSKALSRLARQGKLRASGRGLYDVPVFEEFINKVAPIDIDQAIKAVIRRDKIRLMKTGGEYANILHLTNAVTVKLAYLTSGKTRVAKIAGRNVYLGHAPPSVMFWHGKPCAPVALALLWLGRMNIGDPNTIPALKRLPDRIMKDMVRHVDRLPRWAADVVRGLPVARDAAA